MGDWTAQLALPAGIIAISPWSPCSVQGNLYNHIGAPLSSAWTQNEIVYQPFRLTSPILVQQLWCFNGAVVNGNLDIGVYSDDGTKLVSSGSTAQAGINQIQTLNIADTLIGPGVFYSALVLDNSVGTIFAKTVILYQLRMIGYYKENVGVFPLPANATFAVITGGLWMFGLTARSLV